MDENLLQLKKEIYDIKAVEIAIQDFGRISKITLYDEGNYWGCSFEKCRFSIERTIKEFENYLIAQCNQKGM